MYLWYCSKLLSVWKPFCFPIFKGFPLLLMYFYSYLSQFSFDLFFFLLDIDDISLTYLCSVLSILNFDFNNIMNWIVTWISLRNLRMHFFLSILSFSETIFFLWILSVQSLNNFDVNNLDLDFLIYFWLFFPFKWQRKYRTVMKQ